MVLTLAKNYGGLGTCTAVSSRSAAVLRRAAPPRHAAVLPRRATHPTASQLRRTGRVLAAKETETKGNETEPTPPQDSQDETQAAAKQEFAQEEIAAMVAERRAAKAAAPSSSNAVSGALEEAKLIIWPSVGEALVNTVVVIGIVLVTAAMLFGVNTGLAKLSNFVYKPSSEATPKAAPASQASPAAAPSSPAPAVETAAEEEAITSNVPKTL